MQDTITSEKLEKYFSVTGTALQKAQQALNPKKQKEADEVIDMAQRYYDDAGYFLKEKNDAVLAFAALNYAHGWLDAGARLKLFLVNDSTLFAVDENTIEEEAIKKNTAKKKKKQDSTKTG